MSHASDYLPSAKEMLVVCAHPDDESFGLGAVIAAFSDRGTQVRVLCFTHGEASTLGETSRPLGDVRTEELNAAAKVLGIHDVELFSYPDGHLDDVPLGELVRLINDAKASAEMLLVFDKGGITGHPDHSHATAAALLAAKLSTLSVLAWVLPEVVAARLNAEFETTFVGCPAAEVDIVFQVDRSRQSAAIACHASQSGDNPVLRRRLELLGTLEHLRWLTEEASDR